MKDLTTFVILVFAILALGVAFSPCRDPVPGVAGPGPMAADSGQSDGPDVAGEFHPSPLTCDDLTCGCLRRFATPHCVDQEECTCPPWDRGHRGRLPGR